MKTFKITLELNEEELKLLSYGWRSFYYDGEQLHFNVPLAPYEDKRKRYNDECEKARTLLNKLPKLITESYKK